MSVHEILSLIACATTQISLHIFKVSPELSCTDTYIHVANDIQLKYIWAGRRDLILTPVALLRKRLSERFLGSWR